jgi:hypothetical protein
MAHHFVDEITGKTISVGLFISSYAADAWRHAARYFQRAHFESALDVNASSPLVVLTMS